MWIDKEIKFFLESISIRPKLTSGYVRPIKSGSYSTAIDEALFSEEDVSSKKKLFW